MGVLDWLTRGFAPMEEAPQTRSIDQFRDFPSTDAQLLGLWNARKGGPGPWRAPSIKEALSVPAIQRAVSLISNTIGSLSLQSYRDGSPTVAVAPLLARPDPYSTPGEFYSAAGYNLASRGEAVLWIAKRDADNLPISLIVVPLAELTVMPNPDNRLRPVYEWGDVTSTRYSPASKDGDFVHIFYMREPGQLRGVGPLQLCGAAASVAVEAQEWAANFFAEGGYPSILIKAANKLGLDPLTGEHEADILRRDFASKDHNTPRVIDEGVDAVEQFKVDPAGAQMLQAREYNNGDWARAFGIPGALMEYSVAGSSLTYQNIAEVYTQFVRTSLSINYLEKIEQALTDCLTRSTIARFDVWGLQRADQKTRYETWKIGIEAGIVTPEYAQEQEGIIPGSVELAPVPFAPPQAVPDRIPDFLAASADPVRCSGQRMLRGLLKPCNKLLAQAGPFIGRCERCGTVYEAA